MTSVTWGYIEGKRTGYYHTSSECVEQMRKVPGMRVETLEIGPSDERPSRYALCPDCEKRERQVMP